MTKTTTTDNEIQFCRLCLEENDLTANLFYDEDSDGNKMLSQKLFELFQIKYEKTPSLPNRVCKECLEMIKTFSVFRENVHKIESELQKRVATLKYSVAMEAHPRPGLNGYPGAFVPEENEVIIEVNPDIDFESSDDDFSMDSDSEVEDESLPDTKVEQLGTVKNKELETLSKPDENSETINVKFSDEIKYKKINQVNETTMLIKWNIVEKSYMMKGAPTKITYSCQYCDTTFGEKKDCEKHVFGHNPIAPFRCSFCPLEFMDRHELIAHIRASHNSERPHTCTMCKKGFLRRSDLRKHTIVHTGIRPFTCSICSKSFSRNTNLTKHLRIHTGAKPHICIRCPRSFASIVDLVRHTRTHDIIKPFHCLQCSASYSHKDQLIEHSLVHSKNDMDCLKRPIENLVTDINTAESIQDDPLFKQSHQYESQQSEMDVKGTFDSTLGVSDQNVMQATPLPMKSGELSNRHSLLAAQLQQPPQSLTQKTNTPFLMPPPPKQSHHSKLFACEICSQTFYRERDYQSHQALHLDTLFSCKQCGMIFSRREKLALHELYQHAPQYPCNICRIPFLKQSEYELHMKMHELQQSVTATAQAASLLSSGGYRFNNQQQQQQLQQQQCQQQTSSMLPPPTTEHQRIQQRPSMSDMNFYGQMLPTMNLGFYSESRQGDRNEIKSYNHN